jgi:hypothetical protein
MRHEACVCTAAGTSRRFGFAKFHTQEAAQAALDALRGTLLHGKEMDLKFAVADDPDPGNGVLAKSRAKMRVCGYCLQCCAARLLCDWWAGAVQLHSIRLPLACRLLLSTI